MSQDAEGLKVASETTKQVITLATGTLALTLTFAREFAPDDGAVPVALKIAWLALLVCVGLGVMTLMAITSVVAQPPDNPKHRGAYNPNIRFAAAAMMLMFLVGLVSTTIAVWIVVG
jgi:hypothetical protein